MKWIKGLGIIALLPVIFIVYLIWPTVFPEDKNEHLNITLADDGIERQFRIKRGYFHQGGMEPVQGMLVLYVNYPDMAIPAPWKQGVVTGEMQVVIHPAVQRRTSQAETIMRSWEERGQNKNNGPGFRRYVGKEDGFDIYETLPNVKTGDVERTALFRDLDGNWVAHTDGGLGDARMLGDLIVRYSAYQFRDADPRQMRIWVENFIRTLTVPPLPPVKSDSINLHQKGKS